MTIHRLSYTLLADQRGVTLLLSVLLLAAITSISFSLAAVGFAEINTSNDLIRTEPILYSSLGVADEATFGLKRKVSSVNVGDCDTWVGFSGAGGGISSQVKSCNISPDKNIEIDVPPSANGYLTARKLYLYDPVNNGTGAGGYTSIQIVNSSANSVNLHVYVCRLDFECTTPGPGTDAWTYDFTLSPAQDSGQRVLDPSKSYEVSILYEAGSGIGFAQVTTEPIGLPYLNKKAVEIQSAAGRLIRRLRVLVPTQ